MKHRTPTRDTLRCFLLLLTALLAPGLTAAPASFEEAKIEARRYVYHDRTDAGTLYCGCSWRWVGRSGGRVDPDSCGYRTRADAVRAARLEWEHIVPASDFGRARQCWQEGGRGNCSANDPVFGAMEADLHNLAPTVGEVNADRANFGFGQLPATQPQHGACPVRIDFAQRVIEPSDAVKGEIARVYFYMHDRYDLPMSLRQQRLFMAWNKRFPVSARELERDRRITRRMGHGNPFVTGERRWEENHRNTADGIVTRLPADTATDVPAHAGAEAARAVTGAIRGNRNSKAYHLPAGCPDYGRISPRNIVEFSTEAEAIAAGFRKAGNCR